MNKKLLTFTLLLSGINAVSLGQKQLVKKQLDTKKDNTVINSKKITAIKYAQTEMVSTAANETDPYGVVWSGKNVVDTGDLCHFDLFYGPTSAKFWAEVGNEYMIEADTIVTWHAQSINHSTRLYGDKVREGAADAFLHCYLVAGITYSYGSNFAEGFTTFYNGSYVGSDITESNRATMDVHNNSVAISLGVNFKAYANSDSMTGTVYEKLAKYISHVVKNGKYYDIIQLNSSGLGFVNTTQGVQDPLFPPYC